MHSRSLQWWIPLLHTPTLGNPAPCPANPSTHEAHAVYPLLEAPTIAAGYAGGKDVSSNKQTTAAAPLTTA